MQQHTSAGASTGLSWLGTSASKASVFAPLPDASTITPQAKSTNSWNSPTHKSPQDGGRIQGSPVKHEMNNIQTAAPTSASPNNSSEKTEIIAPGSCVGNPKNNCNAPTSVSNQTSYNIFPTPPKEESDSANGVPLAPTSVTSTSTHQQQPTPDQQKPAPSMEPHQLSSRQVTSSQYHQQQAVRDLKHESPHPPASETTPYSHGYKPTTANYGSVYHTNTDCGKTSLTNYLNKSKSKGRSATGGSTLAINEAGKECALSIIPVIFRNLSFK